MVVPRTNLSNILKVKVRGWTEGVFVLDELQQGIKLRKYFMKVHVIVTILFVFFNVSALLLFLLRSVCVCVGGGGGGSSVSVN